MNRTIYLNLAILLATAMAIYGTVIIAVNGPMPIWVSYILVWYLPFATALAVRRWKKAQ